MNIKTAASKFDVLSNPKRLEILTLLKGQELTVTQITKALKIRKANTSQHLAILRLTGIVKEKQEGRYVFYKLVDKDILKILSLVS